MYINAHMYIFYGPGCVYVSDILKAFLISKDFTWPRILGSVLKKAHPLFDKSPY